jgi:hypothetical protein
LLTGSPVATVEAVSELVAKPQLAPEQVAAKQSALREGIARQNRDAERAKTPVEDRMWKGAEALAEPVNVPEAVKALRDTPERRLYFADTFKSAVDTDAAISAATNVTDLKAMTGIDMTPEQLEAIRALLALSV